jgi:RNA polymerase sigma factor (sigma-70 family)
MRKYKTSRAQRKKKYRYYFTNGSFSEITLNDNVNEQDLNLLHQLDDEELDAKRREDYHVPVHYNYFSDFGDLENFALIAEEDPLERLLKNEEITDKKLLLQQLKKGMTMLKPQQQLLIQKIFYEGYTRVDLAKEYGISEAAIRHRLDTIYRKLRKQL